MAADPRRWFILVFSIVLSAAPSKVMGEAADSNTLRQWGNSVQNGADDTTRLHALLALQRSRSPEAAESLAAALKNTSPQIRASAAYALTSPEFKAAARGKITPLLKTETDPAAAAALLTAAYAIEEAGAKDLLQQALLSDPRPAVRAKAAALLRNFGAASEGAFRSALARESDAGIRQSIEQGLAIVTGKEVSSCGGAQMPNGGQK